MLAQDGRCPACNYPHTRDRCLPSGARWGSRGTAGPPLSFPAVPAPAHVVGSSIIVLIPQDSESGSGCTLIPLTNVSMFSERPADIAGNHRFLRTPCLQQHEAERLVPAGDDNKVACVEETDIFRVGDVPDKIDGKVTGPDPGDTAASRRPRPRSLSHPSVRGIPSAAPR